MKNNEFLPFPTTWIDLKGIMLHEVTQRKTNTALFHLCVESKRLNKGTNKTNGLNR